jgi:hypothetical protein
MLSVLDKILSGSNKTLFVVNQTQVGLTKALSVLNRIQLSLKIVSLAANKCSADANKV